MYFEKYFPIPITFTKYTENGNILLKTKLLTSREIILPGDADESKLLPSSSRIVNSLELHKNIK